MANLNRFSLRFFSVFNFRFFKYFFVKEFLPKQKQKLISKSHYNRSPLKRISWDRKRLKLAKFLIIRHFPTNRTYKNMEALEMDM